MANWDQIKGKVNQAAGDLTDDQNRKLKGYLQETKGNAKELSDNSLEAISQAVNDKIEEFKRENEKDKNKDA